MSQDISTAGIAMRALQKHFHRKDGQLVAAVDGVDLDVKAGTFCVLLGPSGCGKTTMLRCVAGLEHPDGGNIAIDGRTVYSSADRVSVDARGRGLGMVFQDYALWPHLKVRQNVGFPLTTRGGGPRASKDVVRTRVQEALNSVGIGDLGESSISSLSGGQQQRVALARAIASQSDVLLFDEPLSNVDAKVRVQLRGEIKRLQEDLGFTALYVTHDQEEAMELADKLVVLRDGKVEQEGSPEEIYRDPASRYVADFVGSADIIDGQVTSTGPGDAVVATAIGPVAVSQVPAALRSSQEVGVCIRPEDWRIAREAEAAPGINRWSAEVLKRAFLGAYYECVLQIGETQVKARFPGDVDTPVAPGERIDVHIAARRVRILTR